jgi:ABC-type nitrate/sulfonate/bicarbonate transport system substrate-binding protein
MVDGRRGGFARLLAECRLYGRLVAFLLVFGTFSQPVFAADKVKVGYQGVLSYAPLFIAVEKGYLKDVGIEPELSPFGGGDSQLMLVATGQLDVAFNPVAASLYNAVAQKFDLKAVASLGVLAAPTTITPLVIRSDLARSGAIKDGSGLRGMRVAANTPGGSIEYKLTLILDSYGLKLSDVREVVLGYPEQLIAFQNKAIDASVMAEPFATEAQKRGLATLQPKDSAKGIGTCGVVILYNGKFLREKPDVGVRFMQAMIRASKDLQGDKWKDPANLAILSKYTQLSKSTILAGTFPFFEPTLTLEPYLKNLQDQAAVHVRNKRMPASSDVPIDQVVDLDIGRMAVAGLK